MEEADTDVAVGLVAQAMNPAEGQCAWRTFKHHFDCRRHGIADGRTLYVMADGISIYGMIGLHSFPWGPPENVWLSWFAVLPQLQGKGFGSAMLDAVTRKASQLNFMKLYIETYSTPDFARAREFYRARGFRQVGGIRSYLPSVGDMVVFYKALTTSR